MNLPAAGYAQTPLPRKLGFKDGQAVAFVGLDPALEGLASSAAFGAVARADDARTLAPRAFDVVHAFVRRERRNARVGSMVFLMWMMASSTIGPQAPTSTS